MTGEADTRGLDARRSVDDSAFEKRVKICGEHGDPVVEIARQAKDRVMMIEKGMLGKSEQVGEGARNGV